MIKYTQVLLVLFFAGLMGCQSNNAGGGDTPALSANSPQTSRTPSPGNVQKTEIMQSSRMNAPQ